MKTKVRKRLIIVGIIILVIISFLVISICNNKTNMTEIRQIKIGDTISLTENDKRILKNETINNVCNYLKAPSTAQFEENFKYNCEEENIIEVKGYVDSQNSFGAMIRGRFICQYFAIDSVIDTLVYLKFNDTEVFNIKETYMKEYEKQKKLEDIQSNGNDLNQEKLDYILNEFNNDEINDVARITKAIFDKSESIIEVQISAESPVFDSVSENYWIDFNICSIMEYIEEFNIRGTVKIKLMDKEKSIEVSFDNEFLKNKWKGNQQINLVKKIFGENYKEL